MKLGEMLIRDGRLTEAQMQECLSRQARDGGRVGTIMVEMGLIDLDTLTVYLGLELGIPIATGATLERAKATAVRLLTPAQALHFRCIPLIVQDRRLIAAVDDPHDLEVLEGLSRITGYRIIPRVAPEIRIFYYLERYYGVARPARFSVFGDMPRGSKRPLRNMDLPAPPLPGLPPRAENPVRPLTPPPALHTADGTPGASRERGADESGPAGTPRRELDAAVSDAHDALRSEAEDLLDELEADRADGAAVSAPANVRSASYHDTLATMEFEIPEVYTPQGVSETLEAVRNATQRAGVADAIMAFAAGLFDLSALCIVRDNMAFGWKAVGPDVDRERIEALLIPLEAPSMFQVALHNDNLFHGAPFPATLHAYLFKVLRCAPPARATAVPIRIRGRVVNFMYGHRIGRPELDDAELAGLRRVCDAAGDAYVRVIAASKQDGPL